MGVGLKSKVLSYLLWYSCHQPSKGPKRVGHKEKLYVGSGGERWGGPGNWQGRREGGAGKETWSVPASQGRQDGASVGPERYSL